MTPDSAAFRDRIVFAVVVIANLLLLYWPHVETPGRLIHLDKVVHAVAFAALAWTGLRVGFAAVALGVVLVAHALISELVQHSLLPGRSGDAGDVAADVIGVAVGLVGGTWSHERAGRARRAGQAGRATAGRQPGAG